MDAMGVDQAFLYPTWFAEGFPLIEDPDIANALARAYNNWIADFCAGGRAGCSRRRCCRCRTWTSTLAELRRIATIPCFRGVFIRPMFFDDRYFTHPY